MGLFPRSIHGLVGQSSQTRTTRIYQLKAEGEGQRSDREAGAAGPRRGNLLTGEKGLCHLVSLRATPIHPHRQLLSPSGVEDGLTYILPGQTSAQDKWIAFSRPLYQGFGVTGHQANLWTGIDKNVVTIATATPYLPIKPHPENIRKRGLGGSQGPCIFLYCTLATILYHHCASVSPS